MRRSGVTGRRGGREQSTSLLFLVKEGVSGDKRNTTKSNRGSPSITESCFFPTSVPRSFDTTLRVGGVGGGWDWRGVISSPVRMDGVVLVRGAAGSEQELWS